MGKLVRVCSEDELPEGGRMVIEIEGESILVLNHTNKIYALSNICTHEYAEMVNGIVVEDTITCPVHLSRFRLETGEVLNPPAQESLKTYKVIVKDGEVFIEI